MQKKSLDSEKLQSIKKKWFLQKSEEIRKL